MISRITIRNFKSYVEAEVPLAPLTFLIGANASGKSNALEAIRLLSWLARGIRLEDIARQIQGTDRPIRGQASDLFRDRESPLALGCELSAAEGDWTQLVIEIDLLGDDQLVVCGEQITKADLIASLQRQTLPLYRVVGTPSAHSDEITVEYNNFQRGRNKPRIPCSSRQAVFFQLESPGRFESRHEESQKLIPAVTRAFREDLRRIVFLDPRPALMRDYSYEKDSVMKEDGSNVSSVLFQICREREGKEKLLDFIRSLPEQNIVDVRFIETERRDVMIRLVESFGGKTRDIDAPLLSDGTLRVLAVAGLLLGAPAGSLVIIEEIDNGVHPSRAENLVRRIREVGVDRQLRVLLTTHNPALLDAVPPESLADVLCCYRDPEGGDSRIARLGNLSRFPELTARGSLGELVTQRVVDQFVTDTTTSHQRRQKSFQWLEQLAAETAP